MKRLFFIVIMLSAFGCNENLIAQNAWFAVRLINLAKKGVYHYEINPNNPDIYSAYSIKNNGNNMALMVYFEPQSLLFRVY